VPSRGPPVRHLLQMSTEPVTTRAQEQPLLPALGVFGVV